MDIVLKSLRADQLVMDLGCGSGSFQYSAYRCRIVGIDVNFDQGALTSRDARVEYVQADSHVLPLQQLSIDFAVCNHSLEHISQLDATLVEIRRVLKPDGLLWITVPNGFSFSDGLYRWLYAGGGHVNRFTFANLKEKVESATGLRLLRSNTLTSSFIYCKRPSPSVWPYLPRRLKLLHVLGVMRPFAFVLNSLPRILDRSLGTGCSQYGWGYLFGRADIKLDFELPSYFNVCGACGSGNAIQTLASAEYRRLGLRFYRCPSCSESNLLIEPPDRFE